MFHDGVGDAGDIRFLKAVLTQHRGDGLARQDDDGHRVHLGGQEPGHRIGRARARGHEHNAGFAGRSRVTVRHMSGALFVADQDELDAGVDEGVEDRHGRAPRVSKDVLDSLAFEALKQFFCAGRDLRIHGHG